jgi:hypothetical protein
MFAQLGCRTAHAAAASASPEPSTPTMITERMTCLVRSARSFAAMINLRDVSLQVSWWSACGAEHHDHWSAIVGALIPREGLIISRVVSRMITGHCPYAATAVGRVAKGSRRQPGDATGLGRGHTQFGALLRDPDMPNWASPGKHGRRRPREP